MVKVYPESMIQAAPRLYTVEAQRLAYDLQSTALTGKRGELDGWTIRGPLISDNPPPWWAGQAGEAIARATADALNVAAWVGTGKAWNPMDTIDPVQPPGHPHREAYDKAVAAMGKPVPHDCRNATANAGKAYPRSCPACGLGPCKGGVPFQPAAPSSQQGIAGGAMISAPGASPRAYTPPDIPRGSIPGPEEFPGSDYPDGGPSGDDGRNRNDRFNRSAEDRIG
jgi:hypothetical protein